MANFNPVSYPTGSPHRTGSDNNSFLEGPVSAKLLRHAAGLALNWTEGYLEDLPNATSSGQLQEWHKSADDDEVVQAAKVVQVCLQIYLLLSLSIIIIIITIVAP